jgi:hypothetical protein
VSAPDQNAPSDDGRDVVVPLRKLVELALDNPQIGPPLAELAFAIGHKEIGDQLLRLGTDRENPPLEYYFVAAQAARRARRYPDALRATLDAVRVFDKAAAGSYGAEEGERLLQLIRTGLSVLMFDLRDLTAEPELTRELAETMPRLEDRLGEQPLYRSLLAQALWFIDKDASEREWERARELADPEGTWNARGTWYKEAEKDLEKAERAYRRGLEKAPGNALLCHNLAQILVERAEHPPSPGAARHLLNQAQDLLKRSLQGDNPRLRRHVHATRDRLEAIRRALPPPEPPAPRPEGAPAHHDRRDRPHRDDRPPPRRDERDRPQATGDRERAPTRDDRPAPRRDDRDRPPREQPRRQEDPGQAFLKTGTVSLGDILKAKLLKDKG